MSAEWMKSLIDALGWSLVHFLWQGALIALLLMVALTVTRRSTPQVRYAISGIAMLSMFVWSTLTLIAEFELVETSLPVVANQKTAPSSTTAVEVVISAPPMASEIPIEASLPTAIVAPNGEANWLPIVVALWAIGVLVLSLKLLRAWLIVRRLKRSGSVPEDARLLRCFATLCQRMKVSQPVQLLVSGKARVPMVIGWLKPVVLVPASVLAGLPSQQMESILAHELAHIRRGDYLINLLQTVVETLLFFHPAVWWVGAQLRKEREHCCDDIAADGHPLDYAEALAALEGMRVGEAPALGIAASDGSLLGRVRRLVGYEQAAERSLWPVLAMVSALMAGIIWSISMPLAKAAEDKQSGEIELANRAGVYDLGVDEIILEINQGIIHASDVATAGVVHWRAKGDSEARRHEFHIASDAFAVRQPWAIAWEKGQPVLWVALGKMGGKVVEGTMLPGLQWITRIDLSDPDLIKTQIGNIAGPPQWLPDPIAKELSAKFHLQIDEKGKPVDSPDAKAEIDHAIVMIRVINGETGKPIPKAMISLAGEERTNRIKTDSAGKVRISTSVLKQYSVQVASPGWVSPVLGVKAEEVGVEDGKSKSTEIADPIILTVYPGDSVSGRVLDPEGRPIAGAKLMVRCRVHNIDEMQKLGITPLFASFDSGQYSNWITLVRSDSEGRYEYSRPKADALAWTTISCTAEGFAPMDTRLDEINVIGQHAFETEPDDIVMSRGIRVRARVVDADGKPLAGMTTATPYKPGRERSNQFGVSDADGYFEEQLMMPGTYSMNPPRPVDSEKQKLPGARSLAELPLPFTIQNFEVPAEVKGGLYEFVLKAKPSRLVQFAWEEKRALPRGIGGHQVEGMADGVLWRTDLAHCDIGNGTERLCALIPDQIESGFIRILKYEGVFHYLPADGGGPALSIAPVDFSNEGSVLGTVVAEQPARVFLNVHGLGDQRMESKNFEITSFGRFGERKQRGRFKDGQLGIANLYPGESIRYSIAHPHFQTVRGQAENLSAGELREIDLGLAADRSKKN